MGFLDRLLGRAKREPDTPEPASDVHDHPQGEKQEGGAPDEEHTPDDGDANAH